MKLRIKGNMIRYRLSQSEVDIFNREGYLEEKTEFPANTETSFSYILKREPGIYHLEASYQDNKIILSIPEQAAREWCETNQVGLQFVSEFGKGKNLHLLIEKDFKCLDDVDEDQSDNYPNPRAF